MSAADIDAYLAAVPEPKKSTLEEMRRRILAIVPEAEQKISYQMPAFAVGRKVVAGVRRVQKPPRVSSPQWPGVESTRS